MITITGYNSGTVAQGDNPYLKSRHKAAFGTQLAGQSKLMGQL